MSQTNYTLRAEKTLPVSLTEAHRAMQSALSHTNSVVSFKHWSVRYLGFGFRVCQVGAWQTRIELSLNVYLARLPFAKSVFQRFVVPELNHELQRFGWLSETLASRHSRRLQPPRQPLVSTADTASTQSQLVTGLAA